ncbi:hypothetical protein LARV_03710 [Longilinea arvoryzae]|uniref:DUF5667 domain-containing protein n=1 Tax=Longilinea arvoryzae TaxID=360412 RepID=A0A0K8MXI2_9CHLR|nr:hypothetical protein [Longilinea arvoryzae]GAP15915.1 hypothetical protein LARV_03710 [Longilinea arvoryzae]
MPRKSYFNLIFIAALLLGLAFSVLPSGVVSADGGTTVSAAKLGQLNKAYIAQVKELAYQKELLAYARERLTIVEDLQGDFKPTDAAYNTLQWYLNALNTRITNADAAVQSADQLLSDHKGFEVSGYGFKVSISKVTDLKVTEATLKSATEQVALSGKNLRRAMRLIDSAIEKFAE